METFRGDFQQQRENQLNLPQRISTAMLKLGNSSQAKLARLYKVDN